MPCAGPRQREHHHRQHRCRRDRAALRHVEQLDHRQHERNGDAHRREGQPHGRPIFLLLPADDDAQHQQHDQDHRRVPVHAREIAKRLLEPARRFLGLFFGLLAGGVIGRSLIGRSFIGRSLAGRGFISRSLAGRSFASRSCIGRRFFGGSGCFDGFRRLGGLRRLGQRRRDRQHQREQQSRQDAQILLHRYKPPWFFPQKKPACVAHMRETDAVWIDLAAFRFPPVGLSTSGSKGPDETSISAFRRP